MDFLLYFCFTDEMIFHMEDTATGTSTKGVATPGRPLSFGALLTDEKKSGVSGLYVCFCERVVTRSRQL